MMRNPTIAEIEEQLAQIERRRESLRAMWIDVMTFDPDEPVAPLVAEQRRDLVTTNELLAVQESQTRRLLERTQAASADRSALVALIARLNGVAN